MEMLNWDMALIQQLESLHGTVSHEEASNNNIGGDFDYAPIIVEMLANGNLDDHEDIAEAVNHPQGWLKISSCYQTFLS